jgi:hypothetical protein
MVSVPGWQIGWGADSAVTPILDQWVHWAVVYDGANITIYRNENQGTLGGKTSLARTAALGFSGYTGAVQIGSESDQPPNRNWNGALNDVAIFTGVLSQNEIDTVKGGDFSSFLVRPPRAIGVTQTNLVLSWPVVPSGFQLQSSTTLEVSSWTNISSPPIIQSNALSVTLPFNSRAQFFRLIRP